MQLTKDGERAVKLVLLQDRLCLLMLWHCAITYNETKCVQQIISVILTTTLSGDQ